VTEQDAIRVFLGDEAARGGPFALLDLKYAPINESIVRRAAGRALARVNAHPRANTPQAAEVRLAVHAAASQLLDPSLRTQLAARCPEGSGLDAPAAWRAGARRTIDPRLIQRARTILGACGGWNARSRKRLGQFARFHRINAPRLIGALTPASAARGRGPSSGARERKPKPIDLSWLDRAERVWVVAPVVYVLLAVAIVGVFVGSRGGGEAVEVAPGEEIVESTGGRVERSGGEAAQGSSEGPLRRTHFSAIVHELGVAARAPEGQGNPEAIGALGERLVTRWREFDRDSLVIAVGALGTALKRLDDEGFARASVFLEPEDGEPGAMRAALRVLWFGAPEAPLDQAAMRADADLGEALINGGAHVSTRASDDPGWWNAWILECAAIDALKAGEGTALLRSSVSVRMRAPVQDERGWATSAERIVRAMDWGRGEGARIWLLAQIADAQVRSERLSGFMSAMLSNSSAGGLSLEMAIGKEASIEERERVLARLREAWIIAPDGSDADDPRLDLLNRIEELARLSAAQSDERSNALRALELAQLNRVCDAWDRGDEGAMFRGIDLFADRFELEEVAARTYDLTSTREDEAWANAARNTDDPEELARLIDQIGAGMEIGPWTAHGLVYLAMQAPDLGVRDQAAGVVLRLQDEPLILVALDRVLVTSRPSRRMLGVVDAYLRGAVDADEDSERDEHELRREILARLSGFLTQTDASVLGSLERSLRRLGGGREPIEDTDRLHRRLELELIRLGDTGSDHRAAMRAVLMSGASGAADRYVVALDSVVRSLADRSRAAHPGFGVAVDGVLEEYGAMMRRATTGAARIKAALRAQALLWKVEIEAELSS
jgi:hypothetical protein